MINKTFSTSCTESDIKDYGFKSLNNRITHKLIEDMFESDYFFKHVLFFEDALTCLKNNNPFVISCGTIKNIQKKKEFVKKSIGCNLIGFEKQTDKWMIDMSDGVQIDDITDVLIGSNAKYKILITDGKEYEWNKVEPNQNIYVAENWKQIEEMIKFWEMVD